MRSIGIIWHPAMVIESYKTCSYLGGGKNEHFSYFHSSCQLGLNRDNKIKTRLKIFSNAFLEYLNFIQLSLIVQSYKLRVLRWASNFWSDLGITTMSNSFKGGNWSCFSFSWLVIARSSCFLAFWVTNMTTRTQMNNWQLKTINPTLAAFASPNTCNVKKKKSLLK